MNELARPKMNVPKALLRRRRWLQKQVDFLIDQDDAVAGFLVDEWRAEIKWLNYMLRETTGKGRVRPYPESKTCPHRDFPPLVDINNLTNWCNDCQKYVVKQ